MKLLSQIFVVSLNVVPVLCLAGGNPQYSYCDTDCGFYGSAAAAANRETCVPLFPQPMVCPTNKPEWGEGIPNAAPYCGIALYGPRYAKPFTTTGYQSPVDLDAPVITTGKIFDEGARIGHYLVLPYGLMYYPAKKNPQLDVAGAYDVSLSNDQNEDAIGIDLATAPDTGQSDVAMYSADDKEYKVLIDGLSKQVEDFKARTDEMSEGEDIIIDDVTGDVELLPSPASWNTSLDTPASYNNESKIARITGEDNLEANFYATIPASGVYEVQLWWVPGPVQYRSANVPVILHSSIGDIGKVIDQTNMSLRKQWNSLGRIPLNKGDRQKIVTVTAKGLPASSTETMSIDAVRLVKVKDNL